jgi:hypothetical protein
MNQRKELFYLNSQIGYTLYNAPIQGNLFNNNNNPKTFAIKSINMEFEFGNKYSIIKHKKTETIDANITLFDSIQ